MTLSADIVPRVALVGCGWFACAAHIPALRRLEKDGRIELVAICSRSEESLSRASKKYNRRNLKKYTELHELLADPDIDLVDLVLPISIMPNAIRTSLQAGKHVISEKPCAPTVSGSLDLLNYYASLASPPLWAVAENWRFKKATKIIEQIVTSGAIGTVHFADFRHMTFTGPKDLGWRESPDYPGGSLLDSGVHFVALLRKVVGEVERVSATVSQRLAYLPPADSVTAVMSFAGGAEGSFRLSFAAREADSQPGLSLIGSGGALLADFRRNRIQVRGSAGKRLIHVTNDSWIPGGVHEVLAHCVETLRLGTPLRSTAWEAMRDVAVVEAMLESSRINKPVCPLSLYPVLHGCSQSIETYNGVCAFKPRHVVDCTSISDVRSAIAAAVSAGLRVRAMGYGNSWAPHLLTRDVCIRLSGLNRIRSLDIARKTVVVDAGVRLGDLTRALAAQSLSLPSLPFLSDVSVGGAVATATHGTSPKWGTLSDLVRSMKLVLASGEVKELGPDSSQEELRAARVAVGMLGVIVELELQAIDMPWVRFSEMSMDLATFLVRWASILSQYDHVWVLWILGQDEVRVKCLESRTEPAKGFHRYVTDDNVSWEIRDVLARGVRSAKSALRRAGALWNPLSRAALASKLEAM